MASIRDLVPDIKLCLRAKALGWEYPTAFYYTNLQTGWELCTNMDDKMQSDVYAPTLQETLERLESSEQTGLIVSKSPAQAALTLWCKLEELK